MRALELPDFTTPEHLAEHLGWSERRVRETAREIGACRIMGNRMILTKSDVEAILEASRPCPSNSTVVAKSGTIEAPLLDGDYAALQKLRRKMQPRESQPSTKRKHGNVITMDRSRS